MESGGGWSEDGEDGVCVYGKTEYGAGSPMNSFLTMIYSLSRLHISPAPSTPSAPLISFLRLLPHHQAPDTRPPHLVTSIRAEVLDQRDARDTAETGEVGTYRAVQCIL